MKRGFWSGSLHFGLVNIPVSMHPASEAVDLDFDLVDVRDFAPVGYRKINKTTGRDVPRDQIVKVFHVDEEQAVVVTEADFARARPKGARSLAIQAVVPFADIPPLYFDTPYYLEPAGKDAHAYRLLRDTLARTGKCAVAKGLIRTRERLGAVYAWDEHLLFNTLRFVHEIRKIEPAEALAQAKAASKTEAEMARRLIEELEEPWDPTRFRDEYRDELLSYIRKKAKAGEARRVYTPEEPEPEPAGAADLMQLLKKSLSGGHAPGKFRRRPRSAS